MKLSLIIKKHTVANPDGTTRSFYGATAKGKYLPHIDFEHETPDDFIESAEIKGLTANDFETSFIIKITQASRAVFPADEGIYDLEFDGKGWVDRRPSAKRPTVRLAGANFRFVKKHDLTPFDNTLPKAS